MRVTKFDTAYYCHEDLHPMVNQTSNPEIPLCVVCIGQVYFFVQSFCAYLFNHVRATRFVTNAATATSFDACEDAPSSTFRLLDEAASTVFLDGMH